MRHHMSNSGFLATEKQSIPDPNNPLSIDNWPSDEHAQ